MLRADLRKVSFLRVGGFVGLGDDVDGDWDDECDARDQRVVDMGRMTLAIFGDLGDSFLILPVAAT